MTEKTVNVEARTVVFKFDDGTETVFELAKLSPDMVIRFALHGMSQKGGDSYAGAKGEDDPTAYAKASVAAVVKQAYAKEHGGEDAWRASAGGGGSRVTDLATALVRAGAAPDVATAQATIDGLSDDEKKAIRKLPKVAAALAGIAAEKAAAKAQKLAEEAAKAG